MPDFFIFTLCCFFGVLDISEQISLQKLRFASYFIRSMQSSSSVPLLLYCCLHGMYCAPPEILPKKQTPRPAPNAPSVKKKRGCVDNRRIVPIINKRPRGRKRVTGKHTHLYSTIRDFIPADCKYTVLYQPSTRVNLRIYYLASLLHKYSGYLSISILKRKILTRCRQARILFVQWSPTFTEKSRPEDPIFQKTTKKFKTKLTIIWENFLT